MPEGIPVAAFVFGAVLVLIALLGGKFKIFGAEVSGTAGSAARIFALLAGVTLITLGLFGTFKPLPPPPSPRTSSGLSPAPRTTARRYDPYKTFLFAAVSPDPRNPLSDASRRKPVTYFANGTINTLPTGGLNVFNAPCSDSMDERIDQLADERSARLVTWEIATTPSIIPIPETGVGNRIVDSPARQLCANSGKVLLILMVDFVDARSASCNRNHRVADVLKCAYKFIIRHDFARARSV